ncbi:iron-sulfur cluster-binding protein [Salipaludibacillus agaradhaerens]|jgi:L-lactate dehydrogenase complex protein LldF|uniref:LutB/LldF family L-lactate oxidation iron-sulfur protein n=1 Tax=Salipaludibacillus agaradhaerens TaxID=76935 RepID=UPI0021506C4F|nr:LutB/LldF family L-lactate oxidation iron-sulfur protein [Salipaludibacillus agaradhaerens]MCR6106207.1 iron-sulfur cluster-binding protein [Salipaludibacillus agaradhaerens]MCR6118240.1 iron-sulfur cluster-binding protein [Salipaludibacillus agaradhaerens]UJW57352.1 iron-sulfur cluster-binding protein [Bacillus sp. A116_S68]
MGIKISNDKFFDRVDKGINDQFMREAVAGAQERLEGRKTVTTEAMGNWEDWRDLSEEIRQHTLENLDYYLEQFAENVAEQGGHVFFAANAEEANNYISQVVKKKQAKKIIKSKSMVTEEIGLNEALEQVGCDVIESDLGEWILQLDDHDPPSHIVVPALHKNKEQIRDTFHEKREYKHTSDPNELALFAREQLRQEFLTADVGITGCNFAVAESGSISLVTNEGNARLATTLPKTQITVMGMERIVPTWKELDILVSMLCRSAVGQKLTSYITGLTAGKGAGDVDGPEECHIVIVDNGRSNILGTRFQSALQCIRCAACINVCPVYRHVGGHSYGSIYPGPIGAVLTPLLEGYEDYKELPYASSLCAACTDACPVKIPLHELLIEHRREIVENSGHSTFAEKLAMKGYAFAASHPGLYKVGSSQAPSFIKSVAKGEEDGKGKGPGPVKLWTSIRDLPESGGESFRKWFSEREKGGSGE